MEDGRGLWLCGLSPLYKVFRGGRFWHLSCRIFFLIFSSQGLKYLPTDKSQSNEDNNIRRMIVMVLLIAIALDK